MWWSQPRHISRFRTQSVIMVIDKLQVQWAYWPLWQILGFFNSSSFLPFAAAWLGLSPPLSQPISFPATGWAEAQLSIELLCCVNDKEMQWEAVNHSVWRSFFEILQVLFFKSRLCKSPSTPSLTSPLPCALTPLTSSHSGSLSCSPFHAPLLCKEELLSHNSLKMRSVLSTSTRLWVVVIQGTRHPHNYSCGFSWDASPWPYGSGNKEMK